MSVLQFRQRPVKGLAPKVSDVPKYYCRKCNGEKFFIHENGDVSCLCGCFISNLKVQKLP